MKKNIFLLVLISLIFTSCTAATQAKPAGDRTETISAPQTERVTRKPDPTETTVKPETTFVITAPGTLMTDSVSTDFETAPATEDFSSETEVLTTEPLETSEQDAYETVIPDQSYIGEWLSYPDTDSGSLSIQSVNSNSISFCLAMTRGPLVKSTAIEKDGKYIFGEDISPDLVYYPYDTSHYGQTQINGYIIFEEQRIILQFDDYIENVNGFSVEVKTENFYGKRNDAINNARTVLESAGWIDIDVLAYDLSNTENGKTIEPYSEEKVPLCSVIGTSSDMTAVIRVVYDRNTDEWLIADTYYAHANGTVLQGETLEMFMTEKGKTDFILSANDADLIEYFCTTNK